MPTVLFDIDGTLINSGGAGTRAMARTAGQLLGVSGIPPIPVHGRTDYAIFQDLLAALEIAFEPAYEDWRLHYHRWLEHELCVGDAIRPVRLPGVEGLLQRMTEHNWQAAIVTGNSQEAAHLKLRAVGLENSFVAGGYGDWTGCRNHLARVAVEACQSAIPEFCVRNSVMIGDTVHDVNCARSVNMAAIAVTTGGGTRAQLKDAGAVLVVDSLSELTIERLSAVLNS